MSPNPRIHRPSARSFVHVNSKDATITQSTALWQAMRHRQEIEDRAEHEAEELRTGGLGKRLRILLGRLRFFRRDEA